MKLVVRSVAWILLLTMPLGGCYSYSRVPASTALNEGTEVRAYLSEPRSLNLGSVTVNDINQLEGNVYRSEDDSLSMWTNWVHTQYGSRFAANGSVFFVDRGEVSQLEERRLQPGASVLMVGGVVALVVGLIAIATTAGGGGGDDGGGGDVLPQIVLPIGR